MQIEINETEYCKLDVNCILDIDAVLNKKTEIINNYKEHKVPGFRPGKATNEAVKIHFKKEIEVDLTNALLQEAYNGFLSEKQIEPFGSPSVINAKINDNNFSCNFVVYKIPSFTLGQYKDLEIPKPTDDMSPGNLAEQMLQELRNKYGQTSAFTETDFVQQGDSIIVNYQAFDDGTLIDALNVTGELLEVGKTSVPEFDNNLLGMKLGERREFSIRVATDSVMLSLAGKKIDFKVELSMGSKIIPMPLDDELGTKVGFKSFEELKENVYLTAANRVQQSYHNNLMQQAAKQLADIHNFDVPTWITIPEAKIHAKNMGTELEKLTDQDKEVLIKKAESGIRLSWVISKIREEEPEAQLSDDEIMRVAQDNIASISKNPAEDWKKINESGQMQSLFSRIRDEYVLNFVVTKSKIIE